MTAFAVISKNVEWEEFVNELEDRIITILIHQSYNIIIKNAAVRSDKKLRSVTMTLGDNETHISPSNNISSSTALTKIILQRRGTALPRPSRVLSSVPPMEAPALAAPEVRVPSTLSRALVKPVVEDPVPAALEIA